MERNSAASIMEWSIELEKALRSKKPGLSVLAILRIGPRLEQWSREPEPTMVAYKMFRLVQGEDRLFANTILLRLADAFRLGDKQTRLAIVRIFLSEYRNRDNKKKKKSKGNKGGILSTARVHNHLELLTRVKVVFDTGDVESKALALTLFGCWAEFAKDSAHIRYLILSSLVSSDTLEVKASLFAAGCFSELSDDFACIVLGMVVNMVTSSEASHAVRLAWARVFAKIGCSYSVASIAYKTGLKLVLDSLEEDLLVSLLVSLSKLASKSTILISEQVDLLFSFLSQEKALRMRATALRCLHFIFIKGSCHFPVRADLVKALFSTIDESELPTPMQCEALRVLHKILSHMLPHLPGVDMPEFAKLLTVAENSLQSQIMSKSLLSIRVLADISLKLRGRTEMESGVFGSSPLPLRVISLIIDHMTLLVKPSLDLCLIDSKVFQEVQGLFNLLLLLVGEHPDLVVVVLDKLCLFIGYLVNMHGHGNDTRQADILVNEMVDFKREQSKVIKSKLVFIVYRFVATCLENLSEAGAVTALVFDKVKLLVECVWQCSLFDCHTKTIYSLLLHCRIVWGCMVNESKESNQNKNSLHNQLVENETLTLEYANKMLKERSNWPAYRAGTHAACQGAWFTATFIFGKLITEVQSDTYYCWLKSLYQLAHSERKIQLLRLPKEESTLVEWLEKNKVTVKFLGDETGEIGQDTAGSTDEPNHIEKFVGAYKGLCSSVETLQSSLASGQAFCFQRWFMYLRAKVLKAVVDILNIIGTILYNKDNISNNGEVERSFMVECLKILPEITQISLQFKKLAQEFDLIATSFIGMDSKSTRIISSLALSCSLLAFCTGFILFIPNIRACETFITCGLENSESSESSLRAMLIQNLVGRLWHIDNETSTNLCMLFDVSAKPNNCFHLQSRNKKLSLGCEDREIVTVCGYAVSGVLHLQNEANREHNEEILSQVTKDGLQLVHNVIMKWINIPFRTPEYFFKVRPCIGSKLFARNSDTRNPDGISVLPGFHLSLNLCLQLSNLPPDLPVRPTKLYCILYCRVSFQEPRPSGENTEQMQLKFRGREIDDMVEMNEMLLQYVRDLSTKKIRNSKRRRDDVAYAFVQFEPNERGQGFASCCLDISGFPVGSYGIKWHSCCIDNQGSYWSLLPLNAGPVFSVRRSLDVRFCDEFGGACK